MNAVLRVVIVDDEALARRRLERLLEALPSVVVDQSLSDGKSLLEVLETTDVDVVLLDINMPGLDGVATMRCLDDSGPAIIFVTAHSEHAVTAFEEGAVDYLLKPVEAARLKKALDRVRSRRIAAPEGQGPDRIAVPTRQGIILLHRTQVTAALIDGESVLLETSRGQFITDFRLSELEAKLGGPPFLRVHRRALINLEAIERLEPNEMGGYVAHTHSKLAVPVSRQAARELRKRWDLPRNQ